MTEEETIRQRVERYTEQIVEEFIGFDRFHLQLPIAAVRRILSEYLAPEPSKPSLIRGGVERIVGAMLDTPNVDADREFADPSDPHPAVSAQLKQQIEKLRFHEDNGPHEGCVCGYCFAWREGWPHGNRLQSQINTLEKRISDQRMLINERTRHWQYRKSKERELQERIGALTAEIDVLKVERDDLLADATGMTRESLFEKERNA